MAALAVAVAGLIACAEAGVGVGEDDAYAIGCPAIDSVVGGGSAASRATVAGLERLRDATDPSPETRRWIDAAVTLLQTADPNRLPPGARALLVDGCAERGHGLRNLTS